MHCPDHPPAPRLAAQHQGLGVAFVAVVVHTREQHAVSNAGGGDDGGVQAHLGRHLGEGGIGDGLRQQDHRHSQPGDQVRPQVSLAVTPQDLCRPGKEGGWI